MNPLNIQKQGFLCFWGDWFGRPMDNVHTPVSTSLDGAEGLLVIQFDEGETCEIFSPKGIINVWNNFYVEKAEKTFGAGTITVGNGRRSICSGGNMSLRMAP